MGLFSQDLFCQRSCQCLDNNFSVLKKCMNKIYFSSYLLQKEGNIHLWYMLNNNKFKNCIMIYLFFFFFWIVNSNILWVFVSLFSPLFKRIYSLKHVYALSQGGEFTLSEIHVICFQPEQLIFAATEQFQQQENTLSSLLIHTFS